MPAAAQQTGPDRLYEVWVWNHAAAPPDYRPAVAGVVPLTPVIEKLEHEIANPGYPDRARSVGLGFIAFQAQVEREQVFGRNERSLLTDLYESLYTSRLSPYIPAVLESVATGRGENIAGLRLAVNLVRAERTQERVLVPREVRPWAGLAMAAQRALRLRALRLYPGFYDESAAETGGGLDTSIAVLLGEIGCIERGDPGTPAEVKAVRAQRVAAAIGDAHRKWGWKYDRLWTALPPGAQDTLREVAVWPGSGFAPLNHLISRATPKRDKL